MHDLMVRFKASETQARLLGQLPAIVYGFLLPGFTSLDSMLSFADKASVLAPEIANVFLGGYFFFFNHFHLFDFGLNFPPSCLEFSVLEQPNAISLTWTSVSNHLSKYVRSTSFGCNSSFFLLHLSEIA